MIDEDVAWGAIHVWAIHRSTVATKMFRVLPAFVAMLVLCDEQYILQRGHYVFTLSVRPSVRPVVCPVPTLLTHGVSRADSRPATLVIRRPWPGTAARCSCRRVHSCANMD